MPTTDETLEVIPCDPVCGRQLTEAQALLTTDHGSRRYLFCSERCRMMFALHADSYVGDDEDTDAHEAPDR
jgi:YHS domain-containing protein